MSVDWSAKSEVKHGVLHALGVAERERLQSAGEVGDVKSEVRGQFQNQPPIGWLKKYKIDNKILLYGTVTYVTALLLHIVAMRI